MIIILCIINYGKKLQNTILIVVNKLIGDMKGLTQ